MAAKHSRTSPKRESDGSKATKESGPRAMRPPKAAAPHSAHATPAPAPASPGEAATPGLVLPALSADFLETLTGLTDRRHRQISKAGYIPPPRDRMYEFEATLRGLFKYYREHNARTREMSLKSKDAKVEAETKMVSIRLEMLQKRLCRRGDVNAILGRLARLINARIRTTLVREFPGKAEGKTAAEIAAMGDALADRLLDVLRAAEAEVEALQGDGEP